MSCIVEKETNDIGVSSLEENATYPVYVIFNVVMSYRHIEDALACYMIEICCM